MQKITEFSTYFAKVLTVWTPWFSFFSDILLLQAAIVYVLYLVITTSNLYYVLFYLIVQIVLFGLFLSIFQLEIFTAFLWMTEVVIILVAFFLLFNTTPSGNISKTRNSYLLQQLPGICAPTLIISLNLTSFNLPEWRVSTFLVSSMYWDDYYEALYNQNNNDLYGLFLSYYLINSFEFIIIGLVLLLGSVICVQLNKFIKTNKSLSYISFFDIFDYFKDLTKILFLRKQNLVDQENTPSSTRTFKKKQHL